MRTLIAAAALGGLFAMPAWAEDTSLSEVIVTATRLPTGLKDAPGVHVIDRADIDASQAVFAADILETVPGLSLSRNGAFGGVTGVRLRGASVDKTLVLIDGMPQNDPSQPSGGYDFGSLQLADIERIEVLEGPQGSLWGSDAIGGVIALTTREVDGWRANLEGGTYSTVDGSVAVGRRTDEWAANLQASGYRTDGVSKSAIGTEADGMRSWTASLGGRVRVNDAVSLDGRVRYNDARIDIDGYKFLSIPPYFLFTDTPDSATSKSWTGFVRARIDGAFGLRHEVSVSGYDLSRATISGGVAAGYDADRTVVRWTAEHGAPSDALAYLVGAEHETARADLSTGQHVDQTAMAAFGVIRARPVAPLSLTASLRYDDPDRYKARATGRFTAAYAVLPGLTLNASFGQGFKVPTISQAACDFCFPAGPSVGLKPERAEGWDLGATWRSGNGRFDVALTGYRLDVRDQIDYGVGRYVNIDRTRSNGLELEGRAAITAHVAVKAAYAYADAIDRSTGARLLRVPEHQGSASLIWTGQHLSTTLTLRAEGDQADADPSTFSAAPRKGFVVGDLAGGWKLNDQVEFTARVENVTDETFQQSLGYGETGRAIYVGVRVKN